MKSQESTVKSRESIKSGLSFLNKLCPQLLTVNFRVLTCVAAQHLSLTQATGQRYHRDGAVPGWDTAYPSLHLPRDWEVPRHISGEQGWTSWRP